MTETTNRSLLMPTPKTHATHASLERTFNSYSQFLSLEHQHQHAIYIARLPGAR
jgi:hypothetical protein